MARAACRRKGKGCKKKWKWWTIGTDEVERSSWHKLARNFNVPLARLFRFFVAACVSCLGMRHIDQNPHGEILENFKYLLHADGGAEFLGVELRQAVQAAKTKLEASDS